MNINLDDFLAAFFPSRDERIHFRAFKPKDAPDNDDNRPVMRVSSRNQLTPPLGEASLSILNQNRGLYFAPNAGGDSDKDITRFNAVFVESDTLTIEEQHHALDAATLLPSIRVETRRSVHAYWLLTDSCSAEEWTAAQIGLIAYFDGDPAIKNPSRVMRLPFFNHLTYNPENVAEYERKEVMVAHFEPARRYSIGEVHGAFPLPVERKDVPAKAGLLKEVIGNGHRNTDLFSLAGRLRRSGLAENEILHALRGLNESRVTPKLDEAELVSIAKGVMRYSPETPASEFRGGASFAIPILSDAALYGLAGDVVRTIEPHTEAHNAALLVQFLSGIGCLIGKKAYFLAEADDHHTKLNGVLVGDSSKGRKGSSFGHIKKILNKVDETFKSCIQDGLSSGEGLIFHVRDAQTKKSPVKNRKRIVEYQDEIVDEGAKDKRAFVVEPEFARVLRTMKRDGNTLSAVIRQAWDTDRLSVMTKTPLLATETHISIIGHITLHELRRNLDETEAANGFANRFLWVYCSRSKSLPFGGNLSDTDLNPLIERLRKAVRHSRAMQEITRDNKANAYWAEIYPMLSEGQPGLLGSVTSRSEAQVMRLATLYALLDCCDYIQRQHLEAALAFWQYCEDSARYVFGNQTGDKMADKIFTALLAAEDGLTRTEVRDLFNRNAKASEIDAALQILIELGRVEVVIQKTEGRSAEVFLVKHTTKTT